MKITMRNAVRSPKAHATATVAASSSKGSKASMNHRLTGLRTDK